MSDVRQREILTVWAPGASTIPASGDARSLGARPDIVPPAAHVCLSDFSRSCPTAHRGATFVDIAGRHGLSWGLSVERGAG